MNDVETQIDTTRTGPLTGLPSARTERVSTPDLLSEGPVRFLLVSGDQDDGAWGLIGSFWLSIDGERGGFFVSPQSLWRGSEMVRSFKSARSRGWTDSDIYSYWQGQVGSADLHDRPPAARGQPLPGRPARRGPVAEGQERPIRGAGPPGSETTATPTAATEQPMRFATRSQPVF